MQTCKNRKILLLQNKICVSRVEKLLSKITIEN
jgi:hypothetical protein